MSLHIVVINDASTARGGATGLALLSARLMRDRGHRVTLFAGDEGSNPSLTAAGVEVVATGGTRLLHQPKVQAVTRGLYNTATRNALAAWIAANDSPETVYHVHGWGQILSPSIFAALQPVAPRTVTHAHDFFLACPNGVFTHYKTASPCRLRPLSMACLTSNCDKRSYPHKLWRVARTAALRRSFDQSLNWGAIAIIHPDMAPMMELAGYARDRMMLLRNPVTPYSDTRIPAEDNNRLFYIGRIEPDKGVGDLVAAAVQAEMPLTVIGEGSERAALSAAHPDVTFTGWKSHEEIAHLVQGARGVAMASRHGEPFALVVAEASQSGLPVILSDSALLASEVVAKGLGYACDIRVPGALRQTIARLRDAPTDEVRAMSTRAFARTAPLAQAPNGWADELEALYHRVLQTQRF